MIHPAKQFLKIIIALAGYVAALVLAAAITLILVFGFAALVLRTKSVPPVVGDFTLFPAWLLATYLLLRRRGQTFRDIGLRADKSIMARGLTGVLLAVVLASLAFGISVGAGVSSPKAAELGPGVYAGFALALAATVVQAGTEEVIFRGYGYHLLTGVGVRPFAGVLITALLFSLAHASYGLHAVGLLNIFLFGLVASFLYLRTGSLWAAVGFHVAWNTALQNVFGFPTYGTPATVTLLFTEPAGGEWLNGGAYGPEGSLLVMVVFLLAARLLARQSLSRAGRLPPAQPLDTQARA